MEMGLGWITIQVCFGLDFGFVLKMVYLEEIGLYRIECGLA